MYQIPSFPISPSSDVPVAAAAVAFRTEWQNEPGGGKSLHWRPRQANRTFSTAFSRRGMPYRGSERAESSFFKILRITDNFLSIILKILSTDVGL